MATTTEYKYCILTHCDICKRDDHVHVHEEDYKRWRKDTHIQVAFPYLSAGEREMLMTGMHDACFDNLFAGMDE